MFVRPSSCSFRLRGRDSEFRDHNGTINPSSEIKVTVCSIRPRKSGLSFHYNLGTTKPESQIAIGTPPESELNA